MRCESIRGVEDSSTNPGSGRSPYDCRSGSCQTSSLVDTICKHARTSECQLFQFFLLRGGISFPLKADEELVQDYTKLKQQNVALECNLQKAREEGEAWKSLAQNVQEMQEMAMAAFERCNALDKENVELRQAMHSFAEGSASATIQQLQKIILSLTEEVAQYKKREDDLKSKEAAVRNKENNIIIRAMRKQTKELKVGFSYAHKGITDLTRVRSVVLYRKLSS